MAKENTKRILIISAAVLVLIIAAVTVWLLYFREPPAGEISQATTNINTEAVTIVNATTNIASVPAQPTAPVDLTLKRLSELFAERYGSFSTDSDFQNITDLQPYMTDTMKATADNFVAIERGKSTPDFKSVVTKVLSTNIGSAIGGEVEVRLSTQRIESGDSFADNDIYYQDIVLELIQDGDQWLSNAAIWQAKGITAPAIPDTSNTNTSNTNSLDIIELLQGEE